MENLKELNIYEAIRSIVLQTERIKNIIQKIKHKPPREVLSKMLKNCQGDLAILLDAAYVLEQCESDFDVNELNKCFPGCESEVIGSGSL
jgi:hypothetical protein